MICKSGESVTYRGHNGEVHGVALAGDGRHAVSASTDGTVKLWDVTRPQDALTLPDLSMTLAFNPNGQLLASGNSVWNLSTLKEKLQLSSNKFSRVTFSPDGKLFGISHRSGPGGGIDVWTTG